MQNEADDLEIDIVWITHDHIEDLHAEWHQRMCDHDTCARIARLHNEADAELRHAAFVQAYRDCSNELLRLLYGTHPVQQKDHPRRQSTETIVDQGDVHVDVIDDSNETTKNVNLTVDD